MCELLSQEALKIIANNYGYRSDDMSDWDNYRFKPINTLDTEINELGNNDIPDTMCRLYGTPNVNMCPKNKDGYINVKIFDQKIKELLHANNYHLIWLCDSIEHDQEYCDDPNSIYAVDLPENGSDFAVISDLGSEGILFAIKDI